MFTTVLPYLSNMHLYLLPCNLCQLLDLCEGIVKMAILETSQPGSTIES